MTTFIHWWSVELSGTLSYAPFEIGQEVVVMGRKLGYITNRDWNSENAGKVAYYNIRLTVSLEEANEIIKPVLSEFKVLQTMEMYVNEK